MPTNALEKQVKLGPNARHQVEKKLVLGTVDGGLEGIAPKSFQTKPRKVKDGVTELAFRHLWKSEQDGNQTDTASITQDVQLYEFNANNLGDHDIFKKCLAVYLPNRLLQKAFRYRGGASLIPVLKDELAHAVFYSRSKKSKPKISVSLDHCIIQQTTSLQADKAIIEIAIQALAFLVEGEVYYFNSKQKKLKKMDPRAQTGLKNAVMHYHADELAVMSGAELRHEEKLVEEAITISERIQAADNQLRREQDDADKQSAYQRHQARVDAAEQMLDLKHKQGNLLEQTTAAAQAESLADKLPQHITADWYTPMHEYERILKTLTESASKTTSKKVAVATVKMTGTKIESHAHKQTVEFRDARQIVADRLELDLIKRQLASYAQRSLRAKQQQTTRFLADLATGKASIAPVIELKAKIVVQNPKNKIEFKIAQLERLIRGAELIFDKTYTQNNEFFGGINVHTSEADCEQYTDKFTL